jgi:uncharacterized protein with PhoU and TrkA domain
MQIFYVYSVDNEKKLTMNNSHEKLSDAVIEMDKLFFSGIANHVIITDAIGDKMGERLRILCTKSSDD